MRYTSPRTAKTPTIRQYCVLYPDAQAAKLLVGAPADGRAAAPCGGLCGRCADGWMRVAVG